VEVGRDGDISAEGIAGRKYFSGPRDVRAAQQRVLECAGNLTPAQCTCNREAGFAFELRLENGNGLLAVMNKQLNADLFSIGGKLGSGKHRPPDYIKHLTIMGVRSLVVPPDSPDVETLHAPWRETGMMLAPLVIGYSTTFFPYAKSR
jgi:hypothetical protein